MRTPLLASLTLLMTAHTLNAEKRTIPCKTPAVASSCYTTHGRLAVYNGGYPNLRLWKIGTRNLLGIWSGPSQFAHKDFLNDSPEGVIISSPIT